MKKKVLQYRNTDPEEHKRDHAEVGKNLRELLPADLGYIITIEKNYAIRSTKQLRRFWALIMSVSVQTGMDKDDIEREFKLAKHSKVVKLNESIEMRFPKATAHMDTVEYGEIMNRLEDWIREVHPEVKIIDERSFTYLHWMDISNQYKQTFNIL